MRITNMKYDKNCVMHHSSAANHTIDHYYAEHVSIIKSCHNLAPSLESSSRQRPPRGNHSGRVFFSLSLAFVGLLHQGKTVYSPLNSA